MCVLRPCHHPFSFLWGQCPGVSWTTPTLSSLSMWLQLELFLLLTMNEFDSEEDMVSQVGSGAYSWNFNWKEKLSFGGVTKLVECDSAVASSHLHRSQLLEKAELRDEERKFPISSFEHLIQGAWRHIYPPDFSVPEENKLEFYPETEISDSILKLAPEVGCCDGAKTRDQLNGGWWVRREAGHDRLAESR